MADSANGGGSTEPSNGDNISADEKPAEASTTEEHQSGGNNSADQRQRAAEAEETGTTEERNAGSNNRAEQIDPSGASTKKVSTAEDSKDGANTRADDTILDLTGDDSAASEDLTGESNAPGEKVARQKNSGCRKEWGCNVDYEYTSAQYRRHVQSTHEADEGHRRLNTLAMGFMADAGYKLTAFRCSVCGDNLPLPSEFAFVAHVLQEHSSCDLTLVPAASIEPGIVECVNTEVDVVPKDYIAAGNAAWKKLPKRYQEVETVGKTGYVCTIEGLGCDKQAVFKLEGLEYHWAVNHFADRADLKQVKDWRAAMALVVDWLKDDFTKRRPLSKRFIPEHFDAFECPYLTSRCSPRRDSGINCDMDYLRHAKWHHPELLRQAFIACKIDPMPLVPVDPENNIDPETLLRGAKEMPRATDVKEPAKDESQTGRAARDAKKEPAKAKTESKSDRAAKTESKAAGAAGVSNIAAGRAASGRKSEGRSKKGPGESEQPRQDRRLKVMRFGSENGQPLTPDERVELESRGRTLPVCRDPPPTRHVVRAGYIYFDEHNGQFWHACCRQHYDQCYSDARNARKGLVNSGHEDLVIAIEEEGEAEEEEERRRALKDSDEDKGGSAALLKGGSGRSSAALLKGGSGRSSAASALGGSKRSSVASVEGSGNDTPSDSDGDEDAMKRSKRSTPAASVESISSDEESTALRITKRQRADGDKRPRPVARHEVAPVPLAEAEHRNTPPLLRCSWLKAGSGRDKQLPAKGKTVDKKPVPTAPVTTRASSTPGLVTVTSAPSVPVAASVSSTPGSSTTEVSSASAAVSSVVVASSSSAPPAPPSFFEEFAALQRQMAELEKRMKEGK